MLCSEGGARTRTIDEGAREVNPLVDLVLQRDTQVVLAVVLGVEGAPEVYLLPFAVELPHGAAPCVAYPACNRTRLALQQHLHTVTPTIPHHHFVLPCGG